MFSARAAPLKAVLTFEKLQSDEKKFLKSVYATLTAGIVTTAFGGYSYLNFFALPALVCALASVGLGVYVMFPDQSNMTKTESQKRFYAFLAAGFLMGQSTGPLLSVCVDFYPGVIQTAAVATFSVFACLTLASLFAEDRSWLFLGGILSSSILYLSLVSFLNIFFRSRLAYTFEMYAGLLVYFGFVLYDTQITLEQFRMGDRNTSRAAMRFLTDIISIFLRIVRILIEQENKKRDRRQQKSE